MPGKVIGDKLPRGFAGTPSRMSDCVIAPYNYPATETGNIQFGEPVVFDPTTKGIRKIASTDTADAIIGIAVRRMGQPKSDDENGWYYKPGEVVDVLIRGSITVPVLDATGIAARGGVHVCKGTTTGRPAGAIVCQAATGSGADTVQIANAKFSNGEIDSADLVAEITLFERVI